MSEYLPLFAALSGAIVGGAIGFSSAYLIQRQRFKREDKRKLLETYGTIYSVLRKAKMRYEKGDYSQQFPGQFLLSPKEMIEIDGLLAKYCWLVPSSIQKLWHEGREKGWPFEGVGEVESDNVLGPFELKKLFEAIENEVLVEKKTER